MPTAVGRRDASFARTHKKQKFPGLENETPVLCSTVAFCVCCACTLHTHASHLFRLLACFTLAPASRVTCPIGTLAFNPHRLLLADEHEKEREEERRRRRMHGALYRTRARERHWTRQYCSGQLGYADNLEMPHLRNGI